jgi:hypothetical protein
VPFGKVAGISVALVYGQQQSHLAWFRETAQGREGSGALGGIASHLMAFRQRKPMQESHEKRKATVNIKKRLLMEPTSNFFRNNSFVSGKETHLIRRCKRPHNVPDCGIRDPTGSGCPSTVGGPRVACSPTNRTA